MTQRTRCGTCSEVFRLMFWVLCSQAVLAAQLCVAPDLPVGPPKSPALLMDLGHFRQAEAILEPLAQAHPEDANAAWLLSRAKAGLGDLDTALKLAERALLTDDGNAAYHVQVAAVVGRMAEKASLLKQLGLAKRARKELDTALALDPRNLDALFGLMLYYYAAPSFIGGDKQKAQQMADAMTDIHPARGYLAQARLAKERNDPAREEEFYLKAIEADPQYYEANATLSSYYLEMSKPDYANAEKYACEALAIDPGGEQAWKNLAEIVAAKQCWTELDTLVAEAAERNPQDLASYYVAATALLQMGHLYEVAGGYLRKYLAQPPDANEPSLGYAHWKLAAILDKQGRRLEAVAEVERALDEEPSLEGAKKDLKRLRSKSQT
ncbi:MAG: tetratricopeptide repeat protein [Acidobacteriota bacterium]|nr:tetratricopeptide repeat protein [Acidobacteriota bacterium]